ncbi:MAG: membrane protein insertion efficiency factor YidD [Phycisphaerae bacterium]|nr:membrane protein insertion efficiency factor YidD [Phycisphaerae bacterium]
MPVFLIRGYQFAIRPHLVGQCKFCPSCSEYAIEALQRHGAIRGSIMTARRLIRCHPFSRGGIDPVP